MHQHLKRKFTLFLSGTPFKLFDHRNRIKFSNREVFSWDYIQEQRAKLQWESDHLNSSEENPYENLPSLIINGIKLNKTLQDDKKYKWNISEGGFNFNFFFETNNNSEFIHNQDIDSWLDNMCTEDKKDLENLNTMPYSSHNRDYNKHALWLLPTVRSVNTLEKKLKQHHFFKNYEIINAAGGNKKRIYTFNWIRK